MWTGRSAWLVMRSSCVTFNAAVPRFFISSRINLTIWSPSLVSSEAVGSFERCPILK